MFHFQWKKILEHLKLRLRLLVQSALSGQLLQLVQRQLNLHL